jgi:phage-related protein
MSYVLPSQYKILVEPTAEVSLRTRSLQFGDGYLQRSPDGINTYKDTWNLAIPCDNDASSTNTVATLEAFFISTAGIYPITWTPPDSTTANFYLITSWQKKHQGNTHWEISFKLERVYL